MSRLTLICLGAVGSWVVSYQWLTDHVARSSALARLTLFNLRQSPEVGELFGESLERLHIASPIKGEMNHIGGFADISFQCCADGTTNMHLLLSLIRLRNGSCGGTSQGGQLEDAISLSTAVVSSATATCNYK